MLVPNFENLSIDERFTYMMSQEEIKTMNQILAQTIHGSMESNNQYLLGSAWIRLHRKEGRGGKVTEVCKHFGNKEVLSCVKYFSLQRVYLLLFNF